ncbi:MAG: hypothetical protein L7U83_12060 [Akkermansiaceae bacterium]|nr:hypothetical protein [Akkermansiaceae bacterium]
MTQVKDVVILSAIPIGLKPEHPIRAGPNIPQIHHQLQYLPAGHINLGSKPLAGKSP